jgi:hypothetical protein
MYKEGIIYLIGRLIGSKVGFGWLFEWDVKYHVLHSGKAIPTADEQKVVDG